MNKYLKPEISVLGLSPDERFAGACTKEPLRNYFDMNGDVYEGDLNAPDFPYIGLPPHPDIFGTRESVTCKWYISPIS